MREDLQAYSQRQLKAGENLKKILGRLFIQQEIILPDLNSKLVTVTEVRVSPDFKHAKVFFMPLAGINSDNFLKILNEYALDIKKIASKQWTAKFMPNLHFVLDQSFDYAEKIETVSYTHLTLPTM